MRKKLKGYKKNKKKRGKNDRRETVKRKKKGDLHLKSNYLTTLLRHPVNEYCLVLTHTHTHTHQGTQ